MSFTVCNTQLLHVCDTNSPGYKTGPTFHLQSPNESCNMDYIIQATRFVTGKSLVTRFTTI